MLSLKDIVYSATLIGLAITIFFFATYMVTIVIPVILIAGLIVIVALGIKRDREEGP